MPRAAQKRKPKLTKKERYFVNLFLKLGADESRIEECAKRSEITIAAAHKLLKQKAVQKDIAEWKDIIRLEQERQQLVGPAVAQVTATLSQKAEEAIAKKEAAEQELKAVIGIPLMTIKEELLEHEIMRLAVGLDPDRHPEEKRKAIESAYVIKGLMDSGRYKRRIAASDDPSVRTTASIYHSIFNRPQEALPAAPDATPAPATTAAELFPGRTPPERPVTDGMTLPSIESLTGQEVPAAKQKSNVITVEIS